MGRFFPLTIKIFLLVLATTLFAGPFAEAKSKKKTPEKKPAKTAKATKSKSGKSQTKSVAKNTPKSKSKTKEKKVAAKTAPKAEDARAPAAVEKPQARVTIGEDIDQTGDPLPGVRVSKCTEKILQDARSKYLGALAKGDKDRAVRELEKVVHTNCNQLPSKYVAENLNREYFLTAADLAAARLGAGDTSGCLKLLEPLTRPDSDASYSSLGFDDAESFVESLERTENLCVAAAPRPVKKPIVEDKDDSMELVGTIGNLESKTEPKTTAKKADDGATRSPAAKSDEAAGSPDSADSFFDEAP